MFGGRALSFCLCLLVQVPSVAGVPVQQAPRATLANDPSIDRTNAFLLLLLLVLQRQSSRRGNGVAQPCAAVDGEGERKKVDKPTMGERQLVWSGTYVGEGEREAEDELCAMHPGGP